MQGVQCSRAGCSGVLLAPATASGHASSDATDTAPSDWQCCECGERQVSVVAQALIRCEGAACSMTPATALVAAEPQHSSSGTAEFHKPKCRVALCGAGGVDGGQPWLPGRGQPRRAGVAAGHDAHAGRRECTTMSTHVARHSEQPAGAMTAAAICTSNCHRRCALYSALTGRQLERSPSCRRCRSGGRRRRSWRAWSGAAAGRGSRTSCTCTASTAARRCSTAATPPATRRAPWRTFLSWFPRCARS